MNSNALRRVSSETLDSFKDTLKAFDDFKNKQKGV